MTENANLTAARELIALREKAIAASDKRTSNDLFDSYTEYAANHAAGIAAALIEAEAENSIYRRKHLECCDALSDFQCGGKYANFGTIGDHIWNTVPKVIAEFESQLEAERAKIDRMRRAWEAYDSLDVPHDLAVQELRDSHAEDTP